MDTSRRYIYMCLDVICQYGSIRLSTQVGCARLQRGGKPALIFRRKRQQHVAGHTAIAGISGINEDHAAHHDRAGSVEGAALGLDSIYGGVLLRGVKIPKN